MARNRGMTRRMGCCYSKRRRRRNLVNPNQAVHSDSDSESPMEVELRVRDLPAAAEHIPAFDPVPIPLEEEQRQAQEVGEPGSSHALQDHPYDVDEVQANEIENLELPQAAVESNCQETPTLLPAGNQLNPHSSGSLNEANVEGAPDAQHEQRQTNAEDGTLQELNRHSFMVPVSNDISSSSDTDDDDSLLQPQEQRPEASSSRSRRRRSFTLNENSPAFPKATFARLCRQIMDENQPGLRVQKQAMEALQLAAEDYLEGLFADANKITKARMRVTLQPEDVKLALEIRGNLDLIPRTPTRIRPPRLRRLERNSL